MKKILAVVLSLAMILSMNVVGFATGEATEGDVIVDGGMVEGDVVEGGDAIEGDVVEGGDATEGEADGNKPTDAADVEGWTAYYVVLLGNATTDPLAVTEVVAEIASNVTNGEIDMDTFMSAFPEAAKAVGGDVVNQIVWGVEELLSMDLNSDGSIGKPDVNIDDGQLPDDDSDSGLSLDLDLSGFLNTILGLLGSIGDLLFGGDSGSDTPTDEPTDDDNLWGDDGDSWGDDGSSTIPDTGDTTVFAVAAVALAAGAALVMTRKKSEDAE